MCKGEVQKRNKDFGVYLPFLVFLAVVIVSALLYDFRSKPAFINGDGSWYYSFLPEIFIAHKLGPFVKYPIGTAICISPFFLAGHVIALVLAPHAADGYSSIYQFSVAFAALFYCAAGLILVYYILQVYYHRLTALIVCTCVYFGTMLPVYTTEKASFSHAYAFAAISLFIWLVVSGRDGVGTFDLHERVYDRTIIGEPINRTPNKKAGYSYSLLLGVILGLIFLIRNTDAIIILIYLFFSFGQEGYWKRLRRMLNPMRILVNGTGFLLPVSLQLAYWKVKTGSYFTNSYSGETFQFVRNPKILEVLFSDAKGLFIFCPILVFFLIGLLYLREGSQNIALAFTEGKKEYRDYEAGNFSNGENDRYKVRNFLDFSCLSTVPDFSFLRVPAEMGLACILVFVITVFLYATWWCWWLGGAYSQRTFCDILCIFAVGMGAFFEYVFYPHVCDNIRRFMKWTVCVLAVFFILDNQAFIFASQRGTLNSSLSNWNELQTSLRKFYTAEYYHEDHWWKIRKGMNRFKVGESYFPTQFPQRGRGSYISGGVGWLLFGPYKELPAGEYTVTYYLGLEEGAEIPEDGILGTVGVNSNAGAFKSDDYQKKIRVGDLTPMIENLIIEGGCEDFELQVYAACAGLRIDSIEIRYL